MSTQANLFAETRRRKPNILQLIYKFLVDDTERALPTKCRCCSLENACHNEVVDSADTSRIVDKSMGYRVRKDKGRISKTRSVKRPTSKDLPISYLQKCVGGEGTKLIHQAIIDIAGHTCDLSSYWAFDHRY